MRLHVFVLTIGMVGAGCTPSEPAIIAGYSSESFKSVLKSDFPIGSDGNRLETILREQKFRIQMWPAARNSNRKEANYWDERKTGVHVYACDMWVSAGPSIKMERHF